MIIDNYNYTFWDFSIASKKKNYSSISEIEGCYIIINKYSNKIIIILNILWLILMIDKNHYKFWDSAIASREYLSICDN